MAAKVLAIDTDGVDLTKIVAKLQRRRCSVLSSQSIEGALRAISAESIDIVFLSLPRVKTNLFIEFFAVLRQVCGMIPIVGVLDGVTEDSTWVTEIDLDSLILADTEEKKLLIQVETLLKGKNLFGEVLFQNFQLTGRARKTIVTLFYDNIDFIEQMGIRDLEIVKLDKLSIREDKFRNTDLFLINGNHKKAFDSCVKLRLMKENKYKPIVISVDSDQNEIDQATISEIGCSEVITLDSHRAVISCRLKSLIKYKQCYEDLSERLKKSLFISAVDTATGVYNRSFLDNYLDNLVDKPKTLAILMIDVDKFKGVNDEYGHAFADSMLKYVSSIIKENVRSSDIIARYGGDEFVIIMSNVTKKIAVSISERIQQQVANCVFQNVSCTVSIGVCCIGPNEKVSVRDAIVIADKFMYIAKQNGGNAVKICA